MRRPPLAFLPSAAAFSPPGEPREPAAVAIRDARQLDIVSSVTGERLRVLVWQPPGAVPLNGFPVLYAFDGDDSFGMLTDLAAGLAPAARRAGLRPAMIVAIGYAPGDGTIERRTRDFTPHSDRYVMPERPNGEPWPELGGGDDFLETIEKDVKPLVGAGFPADESTATLFGHSLGGLMTLHALMTRPGSFARYFASSPSLWVNDRRALRDMEAFLTDRPGMKTLVPLRLTVGSEEETLSPWDLRGDDAALRRRWVEGNRMVGNARDLAALIEARGGTRLDFRFDLLDGFDHGSARAVAAQRAIRFAIDGE
ncbi:MAG: alpha/beta hydrolase-fold protein [Aquamicrobium sp.]|uniref:alpha/beta hydrolase n=1 Tax=Aquamicrobium sp. TaxID=1872579 RepID=UPI00349E696A|nr:alpha/beta hydrolase-fold protein [Aquamicrobium sp.]MCO5158571.1 alpha/beta hydrolase-fold protein [Aquamicrobium sp.]